MDFFGRTAQIYASFKATQIHEAAMRLGGRVSEEAVAELWLHQHTYAGEKMHKLCLDLRGFYLKVCLGRYACTPYMGFQPVSKWDSGLVCDPRLVPSLPQAGQFIGSRADFVPEPICRKLALLCDKVWGEGGWLLHNLKHPTIPILLPTDLAYRHLPLHSNVCYSSQRHHHCFPPRSLPCLLMQHPRSSDESWGLRTWPRYSIGLTWLPPWGLHPLHRCGQDGVYITS